MTRRKISIDYHDRRISALVARLLKAGLQAADPLLATERVLSLKGTMVRVGRRPYDLSKFNRVFCVGAGKASGMMAMGLEHRLRNFLAGGLVAVKDSAGCRTHKIRVVEAGHPLPDARSVHAAKEILTLVRLLTSQDLLFVLISGGASSLLAAPVQGITLTDKKYTTNLLLRSGATIQEINVVRKHLSAVKGGKLAAATSATIVSLVLSDVVGDDLATIGSGPTVPDPTTSQQACAIVKRYRLWSRLPLSVGHVLSREMQGDRPETPKFKKHEARRVYHQIIGNNALAAEAIRRQATAEGFQAKVITTKLKGEAQKVGEMIGKTGTMMCRSKQRLVRPRCLIWGGEPTVTVRGKGRGGRAQEVVLSAALYLAGLPRTYVVGFGTDGHDGPTPMAGAIADGGMVERAKALGLDPSRFLEDNDSFGFFQQSHGHIYTGATGTNVNDVYLLLVM